MGPFMAGIETWFRDAILDYVRLRAGRKCLVKEKQLSTLVVLSRLQQNSDTGT